MEVARTQPHRVTSRRNRPALLRARRGGDAESRRPLADELALGATSRPPRATQPQRSAAQGRLCAAAGRSAPARPPAARCSGSPKAGHPADPDPGGVAILKVVSFGRSPRPQRPAARRRGAQRAAPAALHRAHQQLRPRLPAGTDRRRPHRQAMTPPVALTLGDPAGIGGEIALKAWARLRGRLPILSHRRPGDLAGTGGRSALRSGRSTIRPRRRRPTGLPVLDHPLPRPAPPGRPDPANAAAVVAMIARGVELARSGAALALCTNPIKKAALQRRARASPFPGHTEYLAHLCRRGAAGDDAAGPGAAGGAGDDPYPARRGAARR